MVPNTRLATDTAHLARTSTTAERILAASNAARISRTRTRTDNPTVLSAPRLASLRPFFLVATAAVTSATLLTPATSFGATYYGNITTRIGTAADGDTIGDTGTPTIITMPDTNGYQGGVVSVPASYTLNLEGDVTFNENKVLTTSYTQSYGGAIYFAGTSSAYTGTLHFGDSADVTFSDNQAKSFGGAINFGTNGTLEFDNSGTILFSGNKTTEVYSSSGGGGAVSGAYNLTFSGIAQSLTFANNISAYQGGAVRATTTGGSGSSGTVALTIEGTYTDGITLRDNHADGLGGALYSGYYTILSANSDKLTVTGNTSGSSGGAIYSFATLTISGAHTNGIEITGNSAAGEGNGGAIRAAGVNFTGSSSSAGGLVISNNHTTGTGDGGAIYTSNNAFTLNGSYHDGIVISGNTSQNNGGAIATGSGNVAITVNDNLTITNNHAENLGGFLYTTTNTLSITLAPGATLTATGNSANGGGANPSDAAGGFISSSRMLSFDIGASATATIGDASSVTNHTDSIATWGSTPPGIQKAGEGTLILWANNPYTGSTDIREGKLALYGDASIANSQRVEFGQYSVSGANFDISNTYNGTTIKGLSSDSGKDVQVFLGTKPLTINGNYDTTFRGVISSTGAGNALIKSGPSTLILGGANTYDGPTTVNDSGTLAVRAGGSIAQSSGVTLNDSATFSIAASSLSDGDGANQTIKGLNGGENTTVVLGAYTLTVNNTTTDTFDGIITDGTIGANGKLTKSGSGTLTLTNTNTYRGATTVSGTGKLILSGTGSIADSSGVTLTDTALFDISALTNGGATIKTLSATSGNASTKVALGANTLTVGAAASTFYGTINDAGGSVSATGGSLVKSGNNALTLYGNNTYTGSTTVNGSGAIILYDNGSIAASSGLTLNDTGRFAISNVTTSATIQSLNSVATGNTVTIGAKNLIIDGSVDGTHVGNITSNSGYDTLTKSGSSTLTLTNANTTHYGATTVNDTGKLALSGSGSIAASDRLTLNDTATFDISQVTAATSTLKTLTSTAPNTTIALGEKTLIVNSASGISSFAGSISDGGIGGGTGGRLTKSGTNSTLTLSGTNTYTGATTVESSSTLALSGSGSIEASSSVTLNNTATFSVEGVSDSATIAGLNSSNSDTTVALGQKRLVVNGGGSYSGGFTSDTGGTSGSFTKTGAATFTFVGGGTKTITGAYEQNAGVVNLNTTFSAGSATVQTSTLNLNSGTLAGTSGVAVDRAAVYLSNGTLSSSGGNVAFTGNAGTPTVVSGNGSILSGTGAVTVDSYTNFSPGGNSAVGTINISAGTSVTFSAGWKYVVNITGAPDPGVTNDVIVVNAGTNVTVNQIALEVLIPPGVEIHEGDIFAIISASGGGILPGTFADYEISGEHSLAKVVASNGWTFEVARLADGSAIVLQNGVAPASVPASAPMVPEPSMYGVCGGLVVLGFAMWRKRRGRAVNEKLKMKNG